MDVLSFKLEVYEGPLDALLALIQKHKLNIADIEISVLLEQFLRYLEQMQEADMEITADFLEMAARLIYIKSAALLPKHEVEQLKKELEGALIEYALCKAAAMRLKKRFVGFDIFVRKPMETQPDKLYKCQHSAELLMDAYLDLNERSLRVKRETPKSVSPVMPHSYASVFSRVMYVLRRLRTSDRISTKHLYRGLTRSEAVATFLALLELVKSNRIFFSEDNNFLYFNENLSNNINGVMHEV